ncbi:MAG: (Fe-S)-binding protein [Desulfobacterales bacterium]|nr:(Fe-S)-binding protein [Desulfobacterales bacterium]
MALTQYKYMDIIHRCFRCGYCKFPLDWEDVDNCPSYARHRLESYSNGGRLWLIRAWITGEIPWSEHLADIVYSCVACKNCEEKCPLSFSDDIINMVTAARNLMVDQGLVPPAAKKYLENVQLHGNPWGLGAKKRDQWMADLSLEPYRDQEFLYFVGSEGAYDSRAQSAARALAGVLQKAGVSFGVLGNTETDDGNEAELLGEDGLVEVLAEKNIARFAEHGVKKIITLSPHAYNALKNIYPRHGGEFAVYHYTQVLADLVRAGKLAAPKLAPVKITYHDPCFLGRWNNEYKAPRKVLQSIGGVQLLEMGRNRKSAFCCGGGSGNYYMDLLGGSTDSPARIRVRQASATGADVLAVACPNCLSMLEDAVKVEGLESKLMVKDISEIMYGTE